MKSNLKKTNHVFKYFTAILLSCLALLIFTDIDAKTIYLSSTGNDSNDGTRSNPILTLHKAKQICYSSTDTSFTILLKGGDIFTEHIGTKSNFDGDRVCAFIWNIDKPLTISTYGSSEKALLYGGYYKHNGGPVVAILITEPGTKDVLIENLAFEMWEEGTIIVYETEDVTIRNIRVDKVGTYYFMDEIDRSAFLPSGIYPKNSYRVLIDSVVMTNVLNRRGDRGGLHGFYCTRLGDSEIRNCVLINVCGSAFKIRRETIDRTPNNIYIHDNQCYYTGLSSNVPDDESYQPGFLRYSGEYYSDNTPNCPSAIVIENNIFHYPFCWENEGEDCSSARAIKCSVSNENACGDNACSEDTNKVKWINNDFKYQWEMSEHWTGRNTIAPSAPTNLTAVAVLDSQINLIWQHDMINGQRFVIERKNEWSGFKALRIVDENVTSYSDKNLADSTLYTYRIKACHDDVCSEYSNEATDSTSGGVRVLAPSWLSATVASDNTINLRWWDRSNNEHGFIIERKHASFEYSILDTVDANVNFYADTLVEGSTTYYYRVNAFRYNTHTNYSNEASATITVVVSYKEDSEKPRDFALEQNYPNPFNPSTTIAYQLPKSCIVRLKVFNLQGQVVETLVDAFQSGGYYQLIWQPEGLPSGHYLIQLQAGDFQKMNKVIFQK